MRSRSPVNFFRNNFAATVIIAVAAGGAAVAACSSDNSLTQPNLAAPYSGSGVSGTVGTADPTPLVAIVTDEDGRGVAGVSVTFAASGGVTLATATATTDANGLATTTATFGTKAGTDTVTVEAAGVATAPGIFYLTSNAGAPSAIVAESGNNQTAQIGTGVELVALVTDQYGNPVPDTKVDWTVTAGSLTNVVDADSTGAVDDFLQLPSTPTTVTATATIDGTAIKASFIDMATN